MRILKTIRKIEKAAYPSYMQGLQDCMTLRDVAEYAECEVDELIVAQEDDWYLICANHEDYVEVVDLASTGECNIFKVLRMVLDFHKPIYLDAREETSYPIIKALASRAHASIIRDESWTWGDTVMHEMIIVP